MEPIHSAKPSFHTFVIKIAAILLFLAAILSFSIVEAAGPLEDAWKALNQNKRSEARQLFEKAVKDPAQKTNAALALMFLDVMEMKSGGTELMRDILETHSDPSPFIYALWFESCVTGGYGKFEPANEKLVEKILASTRVNGSILAGGYYLQGLHFQMSQNTPKAWDIWSKAGALKDWEMVGTFDNASGSGFDKDYAPIKETAEDKIFKSYLNSDIHWFQPANIEKDPWITTEHYTTGGTGIVYAQTFVTAPSDIEAYLRIGFSGSIKVWLNDALILKEREELRTELDYLSNKVTLKQGVNRILVQIGFTNETSTPNFGLRLTDEKGLPLAGLKSSAKPAAYHHLGGDHSAEQLQHFAEKYFEKEVREHPENPINALMLAQCYFRAGRDNKAVNLLKKQLTINPGNLLLEYYLLVAYIKKSNRTDLLKQVEHIRDIADDLPSLVEYDYSTYLGNEDYTAAEKSLEKLKKLLGDKHPDCMKYQTILVSTKGDIPGLFALIDEGYSLHPENSYFVRLKVASVKERTNTGYSPVEILNRYLQKNFDYSLIQELIGEYEEAKRYNDIEKTLLNLHKNFPEDEDIMGDLISFYYKKQDFPSCIRFQELALKNRPFNGTGWYDHGRICQAMNNKAKAIESMKNAIHFNPNNFDAREELRELSGKKPLMDNIKVTNIDELAKAAVKKDYEGDDNFRYITSDKRFVLFPEGAWIEYEVLIVKILNESGIDSWKESNFGINGYRQSLNVDRAEIFKKNGQKVKAERYGSEVVFPNLEVGDVIVFEYRIENYTGGKFARDFWHDHVFGAFVPMDHSSLQLMVPKGLQLNISAKGMEPDAAKTTFEDFDSYKWEFRDLKRVESEWNMPTLYEVDKSLAISTLKSWQSISEWYRDLALPMGRVDYNVEETFNEIFPDGFKQLSKRERAEKIYNYICKTIRYSSIPFRNSNYVPNEPMTTLSTQLGDCKDMSLLFHTLAKKAGVTSNLVLVSTRDNGEEGMRVPGILFNHCIVRIDLDNEVIFQELTDNYLPFGQVPLGDENAQALVIPNAPGENEGKELVRIPRTKGGVSKLSRTTDIKVKGNESKISSVLTILGPETSGYRHRFTGISKDETTKSVRRLLEKMVDKSFTLDRQELRGMEGTPNVFELETGFTVESDVMNISGMKALKPLMFETIISSRGFKDEERAYPFQYWEYEDFDEYEIVLNIQLEDGKKFLEMPENVSIHNEFIDYNLIFMPMGESNLKIIRSATIKRNTLGKEAWNELKATAKSIQEAEDIFLGFK